MTSTDLSKYNNDWFDEGAGYLKRTIWFMVNALFFINPCNPLSGLKVRLLRLFGAKLGKGVVIKPGVNIKYPWKLEIGDNTWIGERVWIDNLDKVVIGRNCCLSQEALILIGNHNYKRSAFDLMVAPVLIEDGVWLGARSVVTGGITCGNHSVLSVNSVASSSMEPYVIYRGNPAEKVKVRIIS
ncbi:WcaF family extracellular polysaccharide biosynthesis acetyltransferase [Carboxylicivirga sediminis]|uniref:WcaF family extracellular polysaccharide biosynthesis acetyltransferase n=1 Tax=Carboxylicivirga sediminis TaxID=2006564 RepID=A0A941F483_9BACT|nr:WcaF family extracellular polysaccharide biosynthesis acetyltransferase [Carboxylicivirga sediminis]MBR8536117.1 WcaF family extracellular polysaccharide biosynthesis acetyltransferase [Carboxylicivirga sediminis]